MPIFDRIRSVLHRDASAEDGPWPSIVFLLRLPHLPTAEEAVKMGNVAWGAAGPVELAGRPGPHSFVLRASELTFALHAAPSSYLRGTGQSAIQQQCWDEHSAWITVDLPGRRTTSLREEGRLGSAYASLMFFVSKYWSPNCLALYFPDEGVTVPNQGDLIDSIRWAGRNGIDLRFLKK